MAAGLSRGGYAATTEDFSSGNPVLPGSDWIVPEGPRTEGTAGPYPPGAGKLQGKVGFLLDWEGGGWNL